MSPSPLAAGMLPGTTTVTLTATCGRAPCFVLQKKGGGGGKGNEKGGKGDGGKGAGKKGQWRGGVGLAWPASGLLPDFRLRWERPTGPLTPTALCCRRQEVKGAPHRIALPGTTNLPGTTTPSPNTFTPSPTETVGEPRTDTLTRRHNLPHGFSCHYPNPRPR